MLQYPLITVNPSSVCMSLYPMYLPSVVVVVDVGVSIVDAGGLSVVVGVMVGSSLCTV